MVSDFITVVQKDDCNKFRKIKKVKTASLLNILTFLRIFYLYYINYFQLRVFPKNKNIFQYSRIRNILFFYKLLGLEEKKL